VNKFTRTAVGALAVAAVIAPFSAATASSARLATGKHWTTVEAALGAKQQACKVMVNDGTAWRIYNRLDARRATTPRVAATLTAVHHGTPVAARSWASGWVSDGHVSDVGTFKVPKARGWTLTMTLYGDEAGTGGELTVAGIDRC